QLAQPRPRVAGDRPAGARQQNLDLEDADRVPACAAHGTCRRLLDAIIGWLRSRDRSVLEGKRSGHRLAVPELAGSLRDLEGPDTEPARDAGVAQVRGDRAARELGAVARAHAPQGDDDRRLAAGDDGAVRRGPLPGAGAPLRLQRLARHAPLQVARQARLNADMWRVSAV